MPGRIQNFAGSMSFLRRFLDSDAMENTFHLGIVRDTARHLIPDGGVYDCADMFIHEPGKAWKRGGWDHQSAAMSGETTVKAISTIHIPCRIVAVGGTGTLFNVTSENALQALSVGACYIPIENPTYFLNRLIFCEPTGAAAPKKVYWNNGTSAMAIGTLGGANVPSAVHSCAHIDRIVLARGTQDTGNMNRIWFGPTNMPVDPTASEGAWDTESWLDVPHEITGLASVSDALIVFTPHATYRIIGMIPPHTPIDPTTDIPTDMQVEPLAEVGCTDARSIVEYDENVIFGGTDGIYLINSAGIQGLTNHGDDTGIQKYWRDLFPLHTFDAVKRKRQLIGGVLKREFYFLTILDYDNSWIATWCCHVESRAWTRMTNIVANMYAAGSDEQDLPDLYYANANTNRCERLSPVLKPTSSNPSDGDGTAVIPMIELKPFGQGPGLALRAYGYGWVTFAINGSANLQVYLARTILATTFNLVSTIAAAALKRKRFTAFADTNAMTVRLTQDAASNTTEIYAVEMETRAYAEQSDYA